MDKHREVRTMKRRPKRPTDEQAMLIAKAGLMARDWLVLWESEAGCAWYIGETVRPGESRFKEVRTMEKEIQYIPVGRVRRRRRTWRRTMRDLVRLLMAGGELIGTGILAGAGFGVGLAAVTVFF